MAVFEPNLREPLARSTAIWVGEIAEAVADAQREIAPAGPADPERMASILVAVVEGLSNRWLAGGITTADARSLLSEATSRLLNQSGS